MLPLWRDAAASLDKRGGWQNLVCGDRSGLTYAPPVYRATPSMTSLRLLADDLTGALDSAAEFVALTGPVPVFWHGGIPATLPPNAVLDSGTREHDATTAAAVIRGMVHHLTGSAIAFKKIDSLFRGPTIAEILACLKYGPCDHCVLAPAFPYQDRITRAGRQYTKTADGDWCAATDDLVAGFTTLGVPAQPGRLDADLQPGITVFDAETDDALRRIVTHVRGFPQPVLWCGTGGLAQALACETVAARVSMNGLRLAESVELLRPVLGLFGSDQPVTANQLAACDPHWTTLPDGGPVSADRLARGLDLAGIALASFDLPAGTPRAIAADYITRHIDLLTRTLPRPGTLIAAGGETLRSLCQSVDATSLEVHGRIVPGVPRSILVGGRWNGVTVVSKSGAFGHSHLLCDLLGLSASGTPERRAS